MGDTCAARADQVHVAVRHEVGVRKHGPPGHQPEAVEAFRIGAAVAGEHRAMLPVALRAMRLDVAA